MSNPFSGKHFIVAITGGIAAYKAAILVRLLVKKGATVQILMTPIAKSFITPLTLATLSKRPVLTEFFDPENGQWNSHVELGLEADGFIVAPATANTMAKAAHGIADNLLLTSYLSARCPIFWAPAMDLDMFAHPATQHNMEILRQRGHYFIDPDTGELASGLEGKGRMAEPEKIVEFVEHFYTSTLDLKGKTVMITAGPTHEPIDPVRFIGNRSSGKMGYALAEEAAKRGAKIELISGPSELTTNSKNISLHKVETAEEMFTAAQKHFHDCHIAIFAAAVADYRPASAFDKKIKKNGDTLELSLTRNPDIAKILSNQKRKDQFTLGFALETDKETENARDKLHRKNFDLIVLNSLRDKGAGFAHDTNKITILDKDNKSEEYQLKSKTEVAQDIWNKIIQYL